MSSASIFRRSLMVMFMFLLLLGGLVPVALHAQIDPGLEDPPPEDPDPWLTPVDEMPSEDPIVSEEIFAVESPPFWGETIDGTGATVTTGTDPCPVCPTTAQTGTVAPLVCSSYTGSVLPLKRCGANSKFLCAGTSSTPLRLVGSSADVACHQTFNAPSNRLNFCHQDNWKQVVDNQACYKLNKMRLWVAINGNPESRTENDTLYRSDPATSFPFEYNATGAYWRLDRPNPQYFDRLVEVISRARARGIFVEVTFFAPWEGEWYKDPAGKDRPTGPFGGNTGGNGKMCLNIFNQIQSTLSTCTGTGISLGLAGFAEPRDFVMMPEGRSATGFETQLKRAREAQRNVIRWTVERLWCFDNVLFEIANEPEASKVDGVTSLGVAQWHAEMIKTLRAAETPRLAPGPLQNRHVVAVQPFTSEGANYVFSSQPSGASELQFVDLVNGHYTTVRTGGSPVLNTGAIKLAREFTRTRPIGFNETKISGLPNDGSTTVKSGTEPKGGAASARSEAWEFMIDLGAVYDHWGYSFASANGQETRRQMCYLKSFMTSLPIAQLKAASSTVQPSWVKLAGSSTLPYPAAPESLTANTAYTYWAAAEPDLAAASTPGFVPNYVLYLHRDWKSCATTGACEVTTVTAFRGYHPAPAAAPPTLTLKNLSSGDYTLTWVKPERASTISSSTLTFNSVTQGCAINGGATLNPCNITAPSFAYDIALWVKKAASGGTMTE
jgi:hypothetical protein